MHLPSELRFRSHICYLLLRDLCFLCTSHKSHFTRLVYIMNYTLETKGSSIVPVVTEKRICEPRITGMDEFKTSHATRSASLQIGETQEMTFNQDEHDLARLGYKQGSSSTKLCKFNRLIHVRFHRIRSWSGSLRKLDSNIHIDELRLRHPCSLRLGHVHRGSYCCVSQLDNGGWSGDDLELVLVWDRGQLTNSGRIVLLEFRAWWGEVGEVCELDDCGECVISDWNRRAQSYTTRSHVCIKKSMIRWWWSRQF